VNNDRTLGKMAKRRARKKRKIKLRKMTHDYRHYFGDWHGN
jgi:hypothetical protein